MIERLLAALLALILGACADPNRVADTNCTERWINVHIATTDELAAFVAADPNPACYWRPIRRSVPTRFQWPST